MKQSVQKSVTPWFAPANIRAWRQRLASARTLALVLALTLLVVTESRFDWMERAIGNYLVTTNPYRPQSGVGWRQGLEADKARQTLSEFSSQRYNSQMEAQSAASLGQLIEGIGAENGVMLSAEHFIEIYLKLPPAIAHEIISPYTILAKLSEGTWRRVYLDRPDQPLRISLLDANNQVIQRFLIGTELLGYIQLGEVAVRAGLDTMSDFVEHIYPADKFFSVLNTLSDGMRKRIVSNPEELLRVTGRVRRVGISNNPQAGTVDLGFEMDDVSGPKVILMQGRFEDVWRLQSALEGRYPVPITFQQKDAP